MTTDSLRARNQGFDEDDIKRFLRSVKNAIRSKRIVDFDPFDFEPDPVPVPPRKRFHQRKAFRVAMVVAVILGGLLALDQATLAWPPLHWPEGASAQCENGEFSYSRHDSGTCSGNGGVAYWNPDR